MLCEAAIQKSSQSVGQKNILRYWGYTLLVFLFAFLLLILLHNYKLLLVIYKQDLLFLILSLLQVAYDLVKYFTGGL